MSSTQLACFISQFPISAAWCLRNVLSPHLCSLPSAGLLQIGKETKLMKRRYANHGCRCHKQRHRPNERLQINMYSSVAHFSFVRSIYLLYLILNEKKESTEHTTSERGSCLNGGKSNKHHFCHKIEQNERVTLSQSGINF